MDEKENKLPEQEILPEEQEFDLDDIMKEFGLLEEGDLPLEPEEDVRVWDGVIPEKPAQLPVQDTVRLDDVTRAVKKLEEETTDATVRFTPVGGGDEEEEPPVVIPVQEEKVEPYSEQWEPEYEQPIGEYIPPQPIVFRPPNRLKELKRKLVEGPERRYYELAERGLGKLVVAMILNLIVLVMSVGSVTMYALNLVAPERMKLLVFCQFLFLVLSGLLGSYRIMDGVADMLHKRFSLNSLMVFSFLVCCADAVLCLNTLRVSCCGAFCVHVMMSLWSDYHKRSTEMAQMDTMRKATMLDSIALEEDFYEGRPGFLRGEGQVEDFMDTYRESSGPEKVVNVYALVALLVAIGVGVAAIVLRGTDTGVQCLCAAMLVAVPAAAFVTLSRPMALLQRRLHKHGTILCGWQGVRQLSRNGVFPLTDTDLFPLGTAKLNGVKFYGSRNPDQVVAYSTALIVADGGGMAPLFSQLLESRNGYHYDALGLRNYVGGIGGEVNGEAVLAGTLPFIQSMGVEVPEGTRISQAVYVAIDGTLSGVFAVTYSKVKASAAGLTTLCAYRGLTPVLTAGDFVLTESFLRGKFGVSTKRMVFPDRDTRAQLAACQPAEDAPVLAMTTQEGLASFAYAVTGSRVLRSSSIAGVVVQMLGGILGLLIVLALVIVGATQLLTPVNILLFELLWMIPGILITEWTRVV